jgi:hypothetical protein
MRRVRASDPRHPSRGSLIPVNDRARAAAAHGAATVAGARGDCAM